MEKYEKHIKHPHADRPMEAVCGAKLTQFDWTFVSIDHAWGAVLQGSRLAPCPACAAEVVRVFGPPVPAVPFPDEGE